MGIFKAYDVRGVYPDELNEDIAGKIGNAAAKLLNAGTLVVGRDMRLSSEALAGAAAQGIVEAGCDCLDIGLCETPAHYFAVGSSSCDGGLMTTASHNPPQYNGFKISKEKAIPVGQDSGLREIERMVTQGEYILQRKKGSILYKDISGDYTKHILSFAREIRRLKVVIDASNGMAGKHLPAVLDNLPLETVRLYFELDGRFPNHEPNPLKAENLRDLQDAVKGTRADLGVMFDGDGDRVVFVDENAEIVKSDLLTVLIAREVLRKEPGAAIVYDLRSSRVVPEEIRKAGGVPVRERVGHAFMKATLRNTGAVFGGELSGHYYFRENFCADSGAIAFMKILNLLSAEGAKLSELLKPLQRYCATGEINFEVEDKDEKIRELAEVFSDGKVDFLDGVTVEYDDWWFNVRKSNTEPLLRLNLEAKTPELLEKEKARLFSLLGKPLK